MFIPIEIWTSILKKGKRKVFLARPKHQYHLSHGGECVYDAQSWKERRLLCESMFIPIERWTSILKIAEKEVLLLNPKQQNRLSQQGECVYIAQSWKEGDYYVNPCLSQLKDKL